MSERLPVEPTVHVERFPSHVSCTWYAGDLARFLEAVREHRPDTTAVVDATDRAGRQHRPVADLEPRPAVRYVRVETAAWSCSWERRSSPVVALSGVVSPTLLRRYHRATVADCEGWPDALDRARALLDAG